MEIVMTRPILVTCLCIAAVAGCTRTVREHETVVERPIVHEQVVERPVVRETVIEHQVVGTAPNCSMAGVGYANGSLSCQAGSQYLCSNGNWQRLSGSSC